MKIQLLPVEAVYHSLHTGPQGLSSAEATRRLREFGPNWVAEVKGPSWLRRLLGQMFHLFGLVLWVGAGLAFYAESQQPGEGMATLGGAIVAVILINAVFSFWQEFRAEGAVAALQKLMPLQAMVVRDGQSQRLAAEALVPGDVVLLADGDNVPADCRVVEALSVKVNAATFTGESRSVGKTTAPTQEEDLTHCANLLLTGTSVVSGEAKAVVFATGAHTVFGHIAHLTQTAQPRPSPLQIEITFLSRVVAMLATLMGVGVFLMGQAVGLTFWENYLFAIGIIVANVPEGLLPIMTLTMAMASQRMAGRQALVRHLPAVETLGAATVIVTDKTGTLTQNHMTVKQVFADGQMIPVEQCVTQADWVARHHPLLHTTLWCETVRTLNKNGTPVLEGDPMEVALVEMARQAWPIPPTSPQIVEAMPFDADRKRISLLLRQNDGLFLYSKGALETLMTCCSRVALGDQHQPLDDVQRQAWFEAQERMAHAGLRVLALAWRPVSEGWQRETLEEDLVLLGLLGLEDPPRPEVPNAIAQCRLAGIRVIMATGDHPSTALAIGREIGLYTSNQPLVVRGEDLRKMSDTQLQIALDHQEIVFARTGADQKLRIVQALQNKGQVVAVTGDGVNDAPALKAADIGIAMGKSGTDVARGAADLVLLDDNFATIVAAIEEGRCVFDNIRKFLTYILTSNVPEIVPYLLFVLLRIPLPLTIIQILAVDLGTNIVPALGLGAEPPDPAVLRQPPRPKTERLISTRLALRAYMFLGMLQAGISMAAYAWVMRQGGWHYGQMPGANTLLVQSATGAVLATIVVCQMANVHNCRHHRRSAFGLGFFSNPMVLWGMALELLFLLGILYTPWGNRVFGVAPLPWQVWGIALGGSLTLLLAEELRKRWMRNMTYSVHT